MTVDYKAGESENVDGKFFNFMCFDAAEYFIQLLFFILVSLSSVSIVFSYYSLFICRIIFCSSSGSRAFKSCRFCSSSCVKNNPPLGLAVLVGTFYCYSL